MYQYKIEKNLLFTQQQLKMMNNFSLSSSVWLLVETVSLAACQSDDQAGYVSMPTMSRTAAHVAQPSKLAASVSLDEASHAASSFAPQRMLGKSPRAAMSLGAKAELQHSTEWTRLLGTSMVNQAQVIPIRLGPTEKT